jgi:microcystin-dependent protein
LLGTRFGGDGKANFALPDLRGRTVVGSSTAYVGQSGGSETVTLTPAQLPPHTHTLVASSAVATAGSPVNNLYAKPTPNPKATNPPAARPVYQTSAATFTPLDSFAITSTGGSGAHENRQPYLALNWCICTSGLFPARN